MEKREQFTHSIDELINHFDTKKCFIKRYLMKHFREGNDFVVTKPHSGKHGGHNKEEIMIRDDVFRLVLSTYNTKHRYITEVNGVTVVNQCIMSIENATVGFLYEIYKGIFDIKRQYRIGKYCVDLYIPHVNLVIECDEFGHKDYNIESESKRQKYIESELNCSFIRFDPCNKDFQLPVLINTVNKHIFSMN